MKWFKKILTRIMNRATLYKVIVNNGNILSVAFENNVCVPANKSIKIVIKNMSVNECAYITGFSIHTVGYNDDPILITVER